MLTDAELIEQVKDSFAAGVQGVDSSPDWGTSVRRAYGRRRRFRVLASAVPLIAAACALAAIAASGVGVSTGSADRRSSLAASSAPSSPAMKLVHFAGRNLAVPLGVAEPHGCLGDYRPFVKQWSATPANRRPMGVSLLAVDGTGTCVQASFVPSLRHPAPIDTVRTPGELPAYIAEPSANTRIGYLEITRPEDVDVMARITGGPNRGPYYLVTEIPIQADQTILVELLHTFALPSHPVDPRHLATATTTR